MSKTPERSRTHGNLANRVADKKWARLLEKASGSPIERATERHTVYLLLDCSASMGGDKICQARKGGIAFATDAGKNGYTTGVISFASEAVHRLDPQQQLAGILEALEGLTPRGSTNLADAIELAVDRLPEKCGVRALCIVTDGMPDNEHAALVAAARAKQAGIEILVIGTDDADHEFLKKIATRKDLAIRVAAHQLTAGISSAARLLTS